MSTELSTIWAPRAKELGVPIDWHGKISAQESQLGFLLRWMRSIGDLSVEGMAKSIGLGLSTTRQAHWIHYPSPATIMKIGRWIEKKLGFPIDAFVLESLSTMRAREMPAEWRRVAQEIVDHITAEEE